MNNQTTGPNPVIARQNVANSPCFFFNESVGMIERKRESPEFVHQMEKLVKSNVKYKFIDHDKRHLLGYVMYLQRKLKKILEGITLNLGYGDSKKNSISLKNRRSWRSFSY